MKRTIATLLVALMASLPLSCALAVEQLKIGYVNTQRLFRDAPAAVNSQCSSRQAPAAIPATRSGREFCRCSCGLLAGGAQHGPIHIRPEVLAADGSACGALYRWAVIRGEFPLSVPPKAYRLRAHAEDYGRTRRPSKKINCSSDFNHDRDSTLVEIETSTSVFAQLSTNV